MRNARLLANLVLAALAVALAGCPASLSERAGPPPSLDRALELEHSGDLMGAARVYEELAGKNTGADRNDLLLHAAQDYLAARSPDAAARVLGLTQAPFEADQGTWRALLNTQLALERGQTQDAARMLAAIPEPHPAGLAALYGQLKGQLAQGAARHPAPVGGHVTPEAAGAHIALLLPLSGRAAAPAASVREGFLTAYYQTPPAERPRLRLYDTGTVSIADALTQATQQGADFIVGPLTREEVTVAAEFPGTRPPILALNFLAADRPAPVQFYQFALSPEDEARLAARRILDDHHHRGVAIVPAGDWGTRVLAAFKPELLSGGGDLLAVVQIDTVRTDYSQAITEMLRINESNARFKRLESLLGTKLQFEPRRRGDVEFIFAPAQANTERLLRPQLRFHFAGDIPTYAISDAFEPEMRANEELDGLIFPDMPWILGGDLAEAVHGATREAWPPNGGPARGRLFAFGFDAFRLAQALRHRPAGGEVYVEGLTGRLTIDGERRVHREMAWAQVRNGEVQLLPAPAAQ